MVNYVFLIIITMIVYHLIHSYFNQNSNRKLIKVFAFQLGNLRLCGINLKYLQPNVLLHHQQNQLYTNFKALLLLFQKLNYHNYLLNQWNQYLNNELYHQMFDNLNCLINLVIFSLLLILVILDSLIINQLIMLDPLIINRILDIILKRSQ